MRKWEASFAFYICIARCELLSEEDFATRYPDRRRSLRLLLSAALAKRLGKALGAVCLPFHLRTMVPGAPKSLERIPICIFLSHLLARYEKTSCTELCVFAP